LQAARDEFAQLAATDVLTGLSTRRRWFERAAMEFGRSRRYGRHLGLLMADLDLFKQVNDTFGHEAGDKVLKNFADILRQHTRHSDMAGRVGGEEFAVLLPETSIRAAHEVARRIVESCRRAIIPAAAGHVRFTCSIGVTEIAPADETIEVALRRADAALYDAKRSGRDRATALTVDDAASAGAIARA